MDFRTPRTDLRVIGAEPCPTPEDRTPAAQTPVITEDQRSMYFSLMTRLRMTSNIEEQALLILALNGIIYGNS